MAMYGHVEAIRGAAGRRSRPALAKRTFTAVVVVSVAGGVLRALGVGKRIEALGKGPTGPIGRFVARIYAPFVGFYYSIYARVLDLQPEDEVLDVACGSGVYLKRHAAHVRRIAGLDHSQPMIDEALRQNRERVAARTAEFVVGDVTALPWPDAAFSVVTSNDVDCYPEKAPAAIEEMYRVLQHGGRIAVEGDRRAMMEAVGFSRVSTRRILRGYDTITVGFKV